MEAYQCNITVNMSISLEIRSSIVAYVNILCYLNLIQTKQHK